LSGLHTGDTTDRKPSVLIADADDDTRAMYGVALRLAGFEVAEAADGRTALTRALVDPPSLLLTEITLPLVDGFALCEILRRDAATHAVPILAVTSETRPTHLTRLRASGAVAVLVKPAPPDVVLDEVRRLLDNSAPDAEAAAHVTSTAATTTREGNGGDARAHAARVKSHASFRATVHLTDPLVLHCPNCDGPLRYDHTYIGGVNEQHAEQWDYYTCASCGTFQYRQRTRKLRFVDRRTSLGGAA